MGISYKSLSVFFKNYWFEFFLIASGSFLWLRAIGTHYIWNEVPLGYDPGLYKVWFEEIYALEFWRRNELSNRLQKMFPPFLGMVGTLLMNFGWSGEGLVTRGTVGLSGLVVLMITAISRRFGSFRMSAIVFFLTCSSFVLYELFWWNYLKQMLGLFFLLSGIYVLLLNKKDLSTALVVGVFLAVGGLSQRPALLLCGMVGMYWFISSIGKRTTRLGSGVALGILISIGGYFRQLQVLPMIEPFFRALDVPTYSDGYKAGGTFLTMGERIRTDGIAIVGGLIGFFLLSQHKTVRKKYGVFLFISLILLFWIGGQASFYQRMIGYLSPLLILGVGYIFSIVSYKKYCKYIVGLFCLLQGISTSYWIYASWTPLITQEELELIQQIPQLVEDDAIIMLSGIRYSPRVRGWSGHEVIAPGLFDYTVWGNQGEGRAHKRTHVSGDDKCTNAFDTFGYLERPLYVRVGLTQDEEIMDGWCMQKILQHSELSTSLYRLTDERK